MIKANIYARKHRNGSVSWMVRWKDPKTDAWKAVTAGKTEQEALIALGRVRETLLKGEDPTPNNNRETILVSTLVEHYYGSHRFVGLSKHYAKSVRGMLDNEILPHFGVLRADRVTKETLYEFYFALKAKGYSNETIRKHHFVLAILFDELHERIKVDNPVRRIKDLNKLFPNSVLSREINFLTPEEIAAILAVLKQSSSEIAYSLVKFLAYSGLRRSEAFELKWTDIDTAAGFIHIRTSKSGKARIIPLEPEALEAIQPLKGNGDFIFTGSEGQRFDRDAPLKTFKRAVERAGIEKRVDLHSLRHSYGSNKIRDGWGLKKVSTILGHADISITSKVYSHLLDGDLKVRDGLLLENAPSNPENLRDLVPRIRFAANPEALELVPRKELCALISELEAVLTLLKQRAEPDPVLHGLEGGRKRVLNSG